MSGYYERGPYKRYLTDDDAKIPESTLRRRRLETAQEQSPQSDRHDNNKDGWHANKLLSSITDNSSSDSSTDISKNKEADRRSIDESTSVSSTSDMSENIEPDRSSINDDRCTDQTSDENLDYVRETQEEINN
ncbi:uncharacterized protein LOC105828397 [Monomorium pharaonis]|uniref:uncharacterized protein LOC105828397 n=1 Tax=Monomorium pharaonis TaxID=307658 RepID=UPI00102E1209|nr:uncharacterized protein LOC105828397 [Monomorium pharaonis]